MPPSKPDVPLRWLRALAVRGCGPAAIAWLGGKPDEAPPGSLGAGEAALTLVGQAETGLTDGRRGAVSWFGVRVGARRLADAEYWLGRAGLTEAAAICGAQARLVGGLQYPLVTGDDHAVAEVLRDLAPTYRQLSRALSG